MVLNQPFGEPPVRWPFPYLAAFGVGLSLVLVAGYVYNRGGVLLGLTGWGAWGLVAGGVLCLMGIAYLAERRGARKDA